MPRIRRPADGQDGAAVKPHNRPPAALIPKPFHKLIAEYDQLTAEAEHAAADVRDMIDNWVEHRQAAIRADAQAAAVAVRAGQPITADAHAADLDRRLEQTKARRDALTGAAAAIVYEINDVRYAEQGKPAYEAAVVKARAALAEATAAVRTKAAALTEAAALAEWVHRQLPWDTTGTLDVREVAPAVAGHLTREINPITTRVADVLDALDNL